MTDPLRSLHGVLAVEIDLHRLPDDGSGFNARWPRAQAVELAELIGRDLAGWFPQVSQAGLVATAAAHSFASLLRPGLPAFSTQAALFAGSQPGAFSPGQLAIGAGEDGSLPDSRLEPGGEFAPLLLLPWSLLGPEPVIAPLADEMEERLGELGAAQPPTLHPLEQLLQLPVTHAGYLTLNDACALASLQYQQIGCDRLWSLLDAAIFTPQRSFHERLDGQPVAAANGEVWLGFAPIESFDGDGARWLAWLSKFRQYQRALTLHAITANVADATAWTVGCNSMPRFAAQDCLVYQDGEPIAADISTESFRPIVDDSLGLLAALNNDGQVAYPVSPQGAQRMAAGEPLGLETIARY